MGAYIRVPEELIETVDALVGHEKRSEFFATAAREKIAKIRLVNAARQAAGSLADVDIPGWESSERAAAWVHASRVADDRRLECITDR